MKAHPSKTDTYWQSVHEKHNQNPILQSEYEAWRTDPVTLRMFDDFDYAVLEAQAGLAARTPGDPSILTEHSGVFACTEAVELLFGWNPVSTIEEDDE